MEITKLKPQLSFALKQLTAQLQQASHRLTSLGRGVAEKGGRVREALRRRANEFENLLASCRDAIVRTGDKISKFGSRLSRALKRVTAPFERAGNALTRLGTTVVHKGQSLLGAFRKRTNAWFLAVIAAIRDKITRFRSRLTTALKQVTRPFK